MATVLPVKILSFDPGLTCLGWALSVYDLSTDALEVQKFGGLTPNKIANKKKDLVKVYGSRILALREIEEFVSKLTSTYEPDFVASEDAFFNKLYPSSYAALCLVIHAIERTIFMNYIEGTNKVKESASRLYKLAPRMIKKVATGNSLNFKQGMLESLMDNKGITFKLKNSEKLDDVIGQLNEHSVDAISCGYSFAKTMLLSLICN